MADRNVQAIIRKHLEREEQGFKKYRTNTMRSDLSHREWLNHLLEELMDASIYTQRLIENHEAVKVAKISAFLAECGDNFETKEEMLMAFVEFCERNMGGKSSDSCDTVHRP